MGGGLGEGQGVYDGDTPHESKKVTKKMQPPQPNLRSLPSSWMQAFFILSSLSVLMVSVSYSIEGHDLLVATSVKHEGLHH